MDMNNLPLESRAQEIILGEIQKIPGNKSRTNTGLFVQCPLGTHSDSTPSFGINLSISKNVPLGYYYCFGCKKRGRWNELAKKLGLRQIKDRHMIQGSFVQSRLVLSKETLMETGETVEAYLERNDFLDLPYDESFVWRNIKYPLLKELGARYIYDSKHEEENILLPCYINDELEGVVRGRMEKIKKKNSYFNSAGTWAQRVGLLPYDHVKKMLKDRDSRAICLVEGVRDPLRLIQEGIPALSILGSGMWSKQKLSLIMSLDPSHVFILMDGDEEGRKTSKQIAIDLKATGIPCTKLGLESQMRTRAP
jgi:5S rRNA maturation endonuclease (ribonuclease M5)